MKFVNYDIGGKVVKQDERYIVKDNTELKNLIVSSTTLHRGMSTSGHSHAGQEEVYNFIFGTGEMELDGDRFKVYPGDVVLIKDGVFHRVHNTGACDMYFVCVFDGKRNHQ
jgi:mannose-6-phosphate isomerase-like protein (cupin superfamily)